MDIDTEKQRPIEQVLQSIKELSEQITNDFSDIKEDISFIKKRIEEKEQEEDKYNKEHVEEDKYKILDNNREPEVSKGWFW
jgi:hypothetical protein